MTIKLHPALMFMAALVLLSHSVIGQTPNSAYSLQGTINVDTGTVVLLPTGGKEFDPNFTNNYQAKIRQGRFIFKGKMAYPGSFLIALFPIYVSSPFIIEAGKQTIVCIIDSLREIPKVNNKGTQEVSVILNMKNAVLLSYAKQHPTSYSALWDLVQRMKNGYEPIFDSIYTELSPSLKNTYTGKLVAQRLKSSKLTAIGQTFPPLMLVDSSNRPTSIPVVSQSKYTLIDFWFSHCGPCLSEFPEFKELLNIYQQKGFDIVGISIDKKADVSFWKKVVIEKQLAWSQYLDVGGKITTGYLSISLFPSNFLIDGQGRIIRKNITPVQLGKFLSEKM